MSGETLFEDVGSPNDQGWKRPNFPACVRKTPSTIAIFQAGDNRNKTNHTTERRIANLSIVDGCERSGKNTMTILELYPKFPSGSRNGYHAYLNALKTFKLGAYRRK